MTPSGALNEYERRLSRLRQFATMDETWHVVNEAFALTEANEASIHVGFDAGYAAALKLAGMALAEVQTIALRSPKGEAR